MQKQKYGLMITREQRQLRLKDLFRNHIGRENEISRKNLFETVFGKVSNYNNLEIFYLWSRLKIDMNWLRRTTNYFIGCRKMETGWKYFVVKDHFDIEYYTEMLKRNIKKTNYMIGRAKKAVEKKFYKKLN